MLSIRWAVSAISFHVECGHNFNIQVDVAAVQVYTFQDYSSKHQQHVSFNGFSNIRYTPATTYIFHTVSSSNQELIKYTTKCTSKTQQSQLICQVQESRFIHSSNTTHILNAENVNKIECSLQSGATFSSTLHTVKENNLSLPKIFSLQQTLSCEH